MSKAVVEKSYVWSNGNVFADMGLENADELLLRVQLGYSVRQILKSRSLKQMEVATLLGIQQPEALNLMQGKYHLFSEACLLSFLNKLEPKILVEIPQHQIEGST